MEAGLAARSALSFPTPVAIPAGHQHGRDHNLRVETIGEGRLHATREALRE